MLDQCEEGRKVGRPDQRLDAERAGTSSTTTILMGSGLRSCNTQECRLLAFQFLKPFHANSMFAKFHFQNLGGLHAHQNKILENDFARPVVVPSSFAMMMMASSSSSSSADAPFSSSSMSSSTSSSWPFCPGCRALLQVNRSGEVHCDVCPHRSHLNVLASQHQLPRTTTYSARRPTPLWARSDDEQKQQQQHQTSAGPTRTTIEEPCIKCGHPEVGYYTVQLRSVDEGQTVFYECPQCRHTWSVHN